MREPKNQMLGTMEPPLMQLSVKIFAMKCQKGSYDLKSLPRNAEQPKHANRGLINLNPTAKCKISQTEVV